MAVNVAAFRHTTCDGLGSLTTALEKAGADYYYVDTYKDDFSNFDPLAPDLLIILGGAPGVYQENDYPFLRQELNILEKRLSADRPVLGICLGAQLIAKALGADVYIGKNGVERGWHSIKVSELGKKTPVKHLDEHFTHMLQWHGDTFDLPEGAKLLASSELYPNQIFSWGKNTLGLQCHIEVTPCILKSWIVNSASEVAKGRIDINKVRDDTEKYLQTLMNQSEKFLTEWLTELDKEKGFA